MQYASSVLEEAALDDDFDPISVALRIARAIEACEGAYLVAPRNADGISVVLDLPIGRVRRFLGELGHEFEVGSEKVVRDALLLGRSRRVLFVPTALEVDLFPIGRSEFDEVEFARRRRVAVRSGSATLCVKSAEDCVLRRLTEFLGQGMVSDLEWREVVEAVCHAGQALDFDHLERWAKRLGVAEMLEQARCESAATHLAR